MEREFNFEAFGGVFKDSLEYGDTLRSVGKEMNTSASTLSRVINGKTVDVDTIIKVLDRLKMEFEEFVDFKK